MDGSVVTTSAQLRDIAVAALAGKTSAGTNVFSALGWPTWDGTYPVIFLHAPAEDMESLGPNAPQFTVTLTLGISARVQVPALPMGQSAAAAIATLEMLQNQIKQALINYPPLTSLIQQFPFVRSEMKTSDEGDQTLGELVVSLGLEFYQGPEDFYPIEVTPITQINVDVDVVNRFDPTGSYTDPPFPDAVTPAPRTSGPDGRAEGGLTIDFPSQE